MITSRGVSTWLDAARADGRAAAGAASSWPRFDARLFALDARTGAPCADFGERGQVDLGAGVDRIEGRRRRLQADGAAGGDRRPRRRRLRHPRQPERRRAQRRRPRLRRAHRRAALELGAPARGGRPARRRASTWPPAPPTPGPPITADAERDLVFVPTGSASPDHWGGLRPGRQPLRELAGGAAGLDRRAGVALPDGPPRPLGLRPGHAARPHHRAARTGATIPAVAQATKMGYLFILDRETGEPLFPVEERPVPASDVPGESGLAHPARAAAAAARLSPQRLRPRGRVGPDAARPRSPAARRSRRLRSEGDLHPAQPARQRRLPGLPRRHGVGRRRVRPAPPASSSPTRTASRPWRRSFRRARSTAAGCDADAKSVVARQAPAPYGVRREVLLSPARHPLQPAALGHAARGGRGHAARSAGRSRSGPCRTCRWCRRRAAGAR